MTKTERISARRAKRFPTPTAADAERKGSDYARENRPGSGGDDLQTFVRREALGAVGLLFDEDEDEDEEAIPLGLWPTPHAHEARLGYQRRPEGLVGKHQSLTTKVVDASGGPGAEGTGPLNPAWVEWLMGFPIGWTDLEVAEPLVLDGDPWPPEPEIPRMRRDVPRRAARLKQLGNAVVPKNAELVGWRLRELLEEVEPE